MTTELVYGAASLEERKGYALALSRAGDLVPKGFRDRDGSPNPGKILLAAEYGNMLGLHPMAALTGINVIEGKPSAAPSLMSALVRQAGHKLRVKTTGTVTGKDIKVTVTLIRSDDVDNPFESTWDIDRAKRADLWGKAGSWTKYPEAMLKWRAMSEVCRDGAEDVLMGVRYVPEELGATVDESGEVIEYAELVDEAPKGNNGVRGRAEETEVITRSDEHDTPTGATSRGRSRPQEAAAGPTIPQTTVADEWTERINSVNTRDDLFTLHDDAAKLRVLDHKNRYDRTVESVFLARRDQLQPAKVQPVTVAAYDDETPF